MTSCGDSGSFVELSPELPHGEASWDPEDQGRDAECSLANSLTTKISSHAQASTI
jgi:hypothetical protein